MYLTILRPRRSAALEIRSSTSRTNFSRCSAETFPGGQYWTSCAACTCVNIVSILDNRNNTTFLNLRCAFSFAVKACANSTKSSWFMRVRSATTSSLDNLLGERWFFISDEYQNRRTSASCLFGWHIGRVHPVLLPSRRRRRRHGSLLAFV